MDETSQHDVDMRQYLGGKLCIQDAEPICVDRPIFQALRFAELCLRQFGCAALVWCVYFNKTLANLGFPSIVTRNRFHKAHDISRHFHHSAEKPSRPVVIMRRVNRQGFDVDQRDLTASELCLVYVAELASLFVHRPQRGSLHTKQIREVALLAASLFLRGAVIPSTLAAPPAVNTISEYWKYVPELPDVSSCFVERRPPPAPLHGVVFDILAARSCSYSVLSTFQNTGGAGPSSTPVSDLRQALGKRNWPSGI
ncbi:hypothetical protein AB7M49_006426 [Bradyrhizobium elkanii]